jgi:cytidylate kinase
MDRARELVIAIDGPSGAGKSTAGRILAARLGYVFLDTGAMYRAFALKALLSRVDTGDGQALAALARATEIELRPDGGVVLDGRDVTGEIRTREVSAAASQVSVHPAVRRLMVARQQEMGRRRGGVVMDGRDIGTAVFPDADVKFFVHADPARRAARRARELAEAGIHAELGAIEKDIRDRDHADSTRADSPLARAKDAVDVDTSEMGLEEVVSRMLEAVDAARAGRGTGRPGASGRDSERS